MKWYKLIPAAFLAVVLATGLLTGCAEEGANVSPTGETPPVDEILASLIAASEGIKTYEAAYVITETLSGGRDDDEIYYNMTIDAPAKKIFIEITTEGMEARLYLIDDIIYIKVDRASPQDEPGGWEKGFLSEEHQEKGWNSYNTASRIPVLMGGAAAELLGTETIDGRQAYKITAMLTAGKLLEYMGSSAEEAAEMLADPNGFQPRDIEFTVWVDTGSFMPVRLDTSWTAGNGGETVHTQVTSITYRNINQAVDITLPAEALDAVDVTDKMPSYPTNMPPIEPNFG